MPGPWETLDSITGHATLPSVWEQELGEHFDAFKILCLQQSTRLGGSIPCPNCRCYHTVVPRTDLTGAVGYCRCDPPACPDIPLTIEQITPLEVNQPRLGRAIARALGCPVKIAQLSPASTIQFGSWSTENVPVILTLQTDPRAFKSVIAELLCLGRPYILFAPTNSFMNAACQELLAHAKAAFFTLDTTVRLTEHGTLQPVKTPGELFIQFAPDPADPAAETIARQTIALAKALDSEHKFRKAPLYKVFILYCSDGLSPAQIAKQCGCDRSLIFARLKLLTKKLGRHPSQLRQYSSHLDRARDRIGER